MDQLMQRHLPLLNKINLFFFVLLSLLLFGFASFLEPNLGLWALEHRMVIAILWLLECCWLSTGLLVTFKPWLRDHLLERVRVQRATKIFAVLSQSQKQIISELYATGQIVHKAFNPDNPQVQVLEHERLILRMNQYGSNGYPYYRLAPWVILSLRKNANILSL